MSGRLEALLGLLLALLCFALVTALYVAGGSLQSVEIEEA